MSINANAYSGFSPAPTSDALRFGIDITDAQNATTADVDNANKILLFPRVRSNFKFENKPIYTNVNTSQTGVTSQTLVRFQIEISNLNFDPVTRDQYLALLNAMHIGNLLHRTGNSFRLYYYDFSEGGPRIDNFIVKSCPVTVLAVTKNNLERLQLDSVKFQQI